MDVSRIHTSAHAVYIVVSGEIDLATVDDMRHAMTEAIAGDGVREVLVDLTGVTFCDSSGMEAFDAAYGLAAGRGVRFRIFNMQPMVRRVLEVVGLLGPLTAP
jgi:anti-sigma B factor antagonist